MATPTTDAMYNAISREVQMKYDIYFRSEPMTVTRDDYLVSSSGLEEMQSDSDSFIGNVSSNEITLTLFNDTRIFTPTNSEGPLYGLIKKGIKIVAYGRVLDEETATDWDPLGTYYVTEWTTSSTGVLASVTANDKLYKIFDAPMPVYKVAKNVAIKDLFQDFFTVHGVQCNIDPAILGTLPYGYINDDNKTFITDLTNGALALCYGNREDGVDVISRLHDRTLRATFTDSDQIVTVKTEQSINIGYEGTSVTRNTKQESDVQTVLSLKDQTVKSGKHEFKALAPSNTPLVRLDAGIVESSANMYVSKLEATPNKIDITLDNSATETSGVSVEVLGTYLENSSVVTEDSGSNLLALDSNYIQTEAQASQAIKYLKRIVDNHNPMLELDIRGNFRLKLGDKIHVQSDRYKVDFTGIITRIEYHYEGHLTSSVKLADSDLFEGGVL